VRTDESLARDSFRFSPEWRRNAVSGGEMPVIDRRLQGGRLEDGRFVAHSLSGNERNHLFLSSVGKEFANASLVSGLDNPADSRGFALLDYDRDGFQDIALVNANAPLLNLYRNEIGRRARAVAGGVDGKGDGGFIALRFAGGNRAAGPSSFACRDGYGARVTVELDGLTLEREHRCGEGYASQNAGTMIVGIGARGAASRVTVRWPRGATQAIEDVPRGTLLIAHEDPREAPGGSPFESRPYAPGAPGAPEAPVPPAAATAAAPASLGSFRIEEAGEAAAPPGGEAPRLRLYTTMATWCAACKRHLPDLRRLEAELGKDALEIIGLPIDEKDDARALAEYLERWRPPYRLLGRLPAAERVSVRRAFAAAAGAEVLPSTLVTDASGRILHAAAGVPTLSDLRRLLASAAPGSGRDGPRGE
jgi:thiol-disulfide isomerase/thioredoxin